jgi:TonB dependent receptor-like, beta-barrel
MVNEALATVSLDDVYIPLDLSKGLYNRTLYGIDYPYIFPNGKEVPTRIPTIKITNFDDLNGGPYPSHSSGPIYDFSDNLTKVWGNHTLKFGLLYERSGENDFDQINVQGVPGGTNNQNGQFGFTDGYSNGTGLAAANAALGLFDVYSEIGQRSYTIYRGKMWEWFAQDQWKVTSRLTLNYGLRHTIIIPFDAQWRNMDVFDPAFYDPAQAVQQDPKTGFVIPGVGDRYNGVVIPGDGFPDSAVGRVPGAGTGEFDRLFHGLPSYYSNIHYNQFQPRLGVAWQVSDKTVIRAGGGRFLTRLGVSDSIFLGGNSPFQPIASVSNGVVDNPGGGPQNQFPLTITSQDRIFKNPEAWSWNFTVEREIKGTSLDVSYVGRRGLHAQRERDINQLPPGTLQASPSLNPDYLRAYKGFAILRVTNNDANSIYNGLQVNWNKRFSSGFAFGVSYTLSQLNDDGSSQRDVIPNAFDAHNLWGPSAFDTRHVFVVNYIYALPFFRDQSKLSGKLLGGWQLSGLTQAQTGRPVTIGANVDYAGVGEVANVDSNPTQKNIQFWNINGDPSLQKNFAASNSSNQYWFTTRNGDGSSIFTPPAQGTFAPAHVRNQVYGPGFQNWNIGLFKTFAITERAGFQFRAEAFNFINHPNFDVNGLQINPLNQQLFGKITNKTSERNLQLSLRFSF